ncbi:MAG TPA: hotdog domain-containing protein [Nitriliruptorales bacterium]
MGSCDPGLRCTRTLKVTEKHTAVSMRSGDVPVLSTPTLLALAEEACVAALQGDIPDGQTSVGNFAEINHERPTPVGCEVEAEATLLGHHGQRLEFQVIVRQDDEIVARIRHRRILVDRKRFLDKVEATATAQT